MWKVYIKQISYLLKENKFFSAVYILGTALSITMVMLILMIHYLNTANLGEENKRNRMLYITRGYQVGDKGEFHASYNLDAKMVEDYFYKLKTPEAVSMVGKTTDIVYNEREKLYKDYMSTITDAGYWKLFSFKFVAGRPFNEAEVKGKARRAVIDVTTARKLFGKTEAVGGTLLINGKDYQVCGVVKEVPSYLSEAYSRIWYPYTTSDMHIWKWGKKEAPLGPMRFYILQHSVADRDRITQELQHQVKLMNLPNKENFFSLKSQPYTVQELDFQSGNDTDLELIRKNMRSRFLLILLLLLVPALNLSGLIVSRIKKRGEEIGIRKTFGASTGYLMWQMFMENFVQMLIGGVLGLLLSYGIFQWVRDSFMPKDFLVSQALLGESTSLVEFWHVINPVTALYVVIICFMLNLVSTLLPAWRYARMSIVDALNRR